ncbi:MAG: hypothetical protein K2W85_00360 [Phycisphaerales bacterium]|nr:hypothetical protein [Phycisphaerales bacterium]
MPPSSDTRISRVLQGLARFIIGVVFIWAAVAKIVDLEPLLTLLADVLSLSEPSKAKPLAFAIIACEIGLATWLISGRAAVWALVCAAVTLVGLSLATFTMNSVNPELGCGCGLPRVFPDLSYPLEVAMRNGTLAAIALIGAMGALPSKGTGVKVGTEAEGGTDAPRPPV